MNATPPPSNPYRTREWMRPSASPGDEVFSRSWVANDPRAVVQIAHGMSEHSGRYQHFATHLARQGYSVYANDHLGHGRSMNGHRGTFSITGNGFRRVREDIHSLFVVAREENPGVPSVLLGHSMGSVLSALYAGEFYDIDGLIVADPPSRRRYLGVVSAFAGFSTAARGPLARSRVLEKLSGSTRGLTGDALERKEMWLTRDIEQVRAFIQDELCGFDFSVSGYRDVFGGIAQFSSREWGHTIPDIPIAVVAGDADIAGRKGAAPRYYAAQLRRTGHSGVDLRLFPGDHHEILNELDKADVYDHLARWLDVIARAPSPQPR